MATAFSTASVSMKTIVQLRMNVLSFEVLSHGRWGWEELAFSAECKVQSHCELGISVVGGMICLPIFLSLATCHTFFGHSVTHPLGPPSPGRRPIYGSRLCEATTTVSSRGGCEHCRQLRYQATVPSAPVKGTYSLSVFRLLRASCAS